VAKKRSAGLLVYRRRDTVEVFLVHPGGPFWAKKDAGSWSLPKGEFEEGEDPLEAAKREFVEETGFEVEGAFHPLEPLTQPGGKVIHAWAIESDCDAEQIRSSVFTMEWPPKSGRMQAFPEVDRAAWFTLDEARKRLLAGQTNFIDQLSASLGVR
jgi:predicted NUDIX family NTP pyrophosphohydrolase